MELVVAIDDPRDDDVRALLAIHVARSRQATPLEYSFALDVEQLTATDVTFFSARTADELVGIAALKHLDESHAELKSMHTRESDRGRGVGRALVQKILGLARDAGYRRVSLETGPTDDCAAARRLYASVGFMPCPPFGEYEASQYNIFMTMSIGS